ncbi:FAD-binding protein [Thioclava sp. FR2]|uniref:FAD-binding protein n=1 Tax=Thioclava sp. FR2 TaxID=3445780 RepID=UPI003EC0D1CF
MKPQSEAELAGLIRDAERPFVIVGGGTRSIGEIEGEVLSTVALKGIELYEPGALTLVARAGTPLDEVEAALAKEGQRLPFEVPDYRKLFGRIGESTIGGVVAANASGPRRVQAGACRDSLIGIRMVTGQGEVIKNGGRVMKNVTGYDLVKLMAGSWGTLGVLTEVSFKVLPVPEAHATLVLTGLDNSAAVAAMSSALGSPFEVNGAAHIPGEGTFLRIEGFRASVSYRSEQLRKHLASHGNVEIREGGGLWSSIRDIGPFHGKSGDIWRIAIRPSDAPTMAERLNAEQVYFDWGGGLIFVLAEPGTDLRNRMGSFEGHATRIRGRGEGAFHPEPPAVAALTRGLRAKFDPRGLFNAGLMGA